MSEVAMLRRLSGRVLALPLILLLCACGGEAPEPPDGSAPDLYFGQAPPGDTPVVFAPGVISLEDRYEQFLLYAPDSSGLIFGVTNDDWSVFHLYSMEREGGAWSEATLAPFAVDDPFALTVAYSYGMDEAFFTSARPAYPPSNVWVSRRGEGGWSDPEQMGPPISSDTDEFEVAISRSGALWFSSRREGGLGDLDIYRAPRVDGAYPEAENVGAPVNSAGGDDLPLVAPDESWLIFASDRPGGLGNRDLYITYQVDGAWTEPLNLGAPINTEQWDIYPTLSPDGRYLFFTRREGWEPTQPSDIWWVRAAFIERMRPGARP